MRKLHVLKILLQTGWFKTFYFNLKYFGIRGLSLPVIVSRKFKLKKMGGFVVLGESLNGKIFLGRSETYFLEGRGVWHNEGKVCFNGKCILGSGLKMCIGKEGKLEIGSSVYMTGNSLIYCNSNTKVGDGTGIGWNVTLMDTDQHKIMDSNKEIKNNSNGIFIGAHVWIGINSTILKNSSIPYGSVVAAGSIVSKEFTEERVLIGGTNKVLKNDIHWEV